VKVALYAGCPPSGSRPAAPIGSRLEVLRVRVAEEGDHCVAEFCDDGRSHARLDRPGLDGLPDAAEAGLFDAVWVPDRDRLAGVYAFQMIVLDELARHG